MPLLDHFHSPLSEQRHWTSFHSAWAANIAADLNQHLPERYFAEPHVQFGIEIDVATLEEQPPAMTREQAVAYAPASSDVEWTPPAPAHTIPFPLVADAIERDEQSSLDIWEETLAVGRPLPTAPLWLQGDLCLPVDLEATYERTCSEQRITDR